MRETVRMQIPALVQLTFDKWIFPRTPHGRSRTCTKNYRVPHGYLTNIHGLSRSNFHFLSDTSPIFNDFDGRIFIFLRTSHGRYGLLWTIFNISTNTSWTFTDFCWRILISPRTPNRRSRTFTDNFWFSHECLADAHGLSGTTFYFPTDTSRTLTDFQGRIFIFLRTPHRRSRTFTDNFWFPHGHFTDAHRLSHLDTEQGQSFENFCRKLTFEQMCSHQRPEKIFWIKFSVNMSKSMHYYKKLCEKIFCRKLNFEQKCSNEGSDKIF